MNTVFLSSTAGRVVAAFGLTAAIGAFLLRAPFSSSGQPLTWVDAFFTATSAVCVTGLSTIDVGSALSQSGLVILLVLIQLGGLGITTIATFLLVTTGRATLSHDVDSQEQLGGIRVRGSKLVWFAVTTTLFAEAIGVVALALRLPDPNRWWLATFHSVSAFCNAGFSTYSDSLTRFQSDPWILGTIAALIMAGGLGFIVYLQIGAWLFGRRQGARMALPLHTRVVLGVSLVLWVLGAAVLWMFEWNHGLGVLSVPDRLLAGVFQSISLRTAGFSTVDFGLMREATLFALMFFMFVGGGPGSCAGGIKVTTAAVLLAALRARIRGEEHVNLLGRTIPTPLVRKSFQLVIVALLFISVALLGLLLTDGRTPTDSGREDRFIILAFEAVSAFATVGLSTGITPDLSPAGKLIMMVCMFVGRVGPLAVALAVVAERSGPAFSYPREDLAIG